MASNPIDRFQRFWQSYPQRNGRRLGKKQAFEQFRKLPELDQEACCCAARIYADYCTAAPINGEFKPFPRDPIRFLRGEWWRDWLEQPVKLCGFKSAVPCQELAAPGERLCKAHGDYVRKIEQARARIHA